MIKLKRVNAVLSAEIRLAFAYKHILVARIGHVNRCAFQGVN